MACKEIGLRGCVDGFTMQVGRGEGFSTARVVGDTGIFSMHIGHWVRYGSLGAVHRFTSVDATRYARGNRVVVRSEQGLQLGEVLADDLGENGQTAGKAGVILRAMTVEDELLAARMAKTQREALSACEQRLSELGLPAVLMDVEHLFDGGTLVFYFLGERSAALDAVADELAEAYESKAQFREYARAVTEGCGPDCGTGEGGCDSCGSGCAIASACKSGAR